MQAGAELLATSAGWAVYLPGYVLAVPASVVAAQQWARARRAEQLAEKAKRTDEHRRELQQEVSDMVKTSLRVLTGTDNLAEIHEPSLANPSIRDQLADALEETAALTSGLALMHRALELHLAEPHGGTVPEWMMRAISPQQRAERRG